MKQLVHFPCSLGSRFPRLCSSSIFFSAVFAHVLELLKVLIFGSLLSFFCFAYLIAEALLMLGNTACGIHYIHNATN
jgi:hypothetical protein